jgi:hypothetical protein
MTRGLVRVGPLGRKTFRCTADNPCVLRKTNGGAHCCGRRLNILKLGFFQRLPLRCWIIMKVSKL